MNREIARKYILEHEELHKQLLESKGTGGLRYEKALELAFRAAAIYPDEVAELAISGDISINNLWHLFRVGERDGEDVQSDIWLRSIDRYIDNIEKFEQIFREDITRWAEKYGRLQKEGEG